tara:strand:+ start:2791 stop:3687 length:897 start_codon:yes stop_codon:yes gene_type:complete
MSKNNKFWILLGLTILMSLSGQLFGQVNRILDISPTAYETSVGNQSLIYRNPARNFMTRNDSLSQVTFTRMNWLGHIVSDMTYNYVEYNWKDFDFSFTYKDYGQQKHTDETGVVLRNFSPNSMILYVGWGTGLNYNGTPMKNSFVGFGGKLIKHDLYLEKGTGFLMDVGIHQRNIVDLLDLDIMLKNWGFAPRIGTVTTESPTSVQIGASIKKKNLTLYNQWNIYKGYYTHGQGVKWKYNSFLNLKMGYFNDVKYQLNYPTLGIDLKYSNYILHLGYIGGSENLPLRNTLLTSINVEF